MTTVLLFGAGASAFSLDCTPKVPPLGKDLFSALVEQGGTAATVDAELAAVFKTDFEAGMEEFKTRRAVDLSALLRDLARFFIQFAPGAGNLYRPLIRILAPLRQEVVLASINYDILLELAVNAEGDRITYHGLPAPAGNFSILKLHGSCNFLPALQPRQITGIGFDVGAEGSVLEAPVKAVSPQEVLGFVNGEDAIAPVLALYARGKQVLYCPSFIKRQVEAWVQQLESASRAFIIGVRVHPDDDHIWGALDHSPAQLFYVGPDGESFLSWARERRRRKVHHFADSFQEAVRLLPRVLRPWVHRVGA